MDYPDPPMSTAGTPSLQTTPMLIGAGLVLAMAVVFSGCRSEECARMMACCQQVKEVDEIGEACGPRANSVNDPQTCKTILETVGYIFEEKEDKELPETCELEESS